MIGSMRWNLIFGIVAGLLSFMFALVNHNLLLTALIRGTISFVIMFVLTFLFRWLLALISLDGTSQTSLAEQHDGELGASVDMMTPAEDLSWPELGDTTEATMAPPTEQTEKSFQAFEPPRIVQKDPSSEMSVPDPNTVARALRRLTED